MAKQLAKLAYHTPPLVFACGKDLGVWLQCPETGHKQLQQDVAALSMELYNEGGRLDDVSMDEGVYVQVVMTLCKLQTQYLSAKYQKMQYPFVFIIRVEHL